ncbi:MAG TPA: SGNH/GDSL hydrolase family protein [Candidatus Limnocylindria bacterium]|nr:SGNH/GDSL hydrolase family protein [Candidatus Limnocylindria bacterium]
MNPELVALPDGQLWSVPPRTIQVRPGTNYLAGDLFDGKLHILSRRLHDGAVYFAKVIAGTNGVVQMEVLDAKFPTTAIPKTVAAIAAHLPLKLVLIGDSLTEGAGVADAHGTWPYLTFRPNATTNTWTLLDDVPRLTLTQLGIGGLTADYGLIATRPDSPVLTAGYDLAIVGFGANSIVGDAPLVESMVHALRAAGVEVILQTGEMREDGKPTPFLSSEELLAAVAANQGCELADTYAYMLETDGTYADDKVHPSVLGHQVWAGCIRSVLNGTLRDSRPNSPAEELVTWASLPLPLQSSFPNAATVQFKPAATTGSSAPASFSNSMGPNLGGLSRATAVTVLTNGQSASFHADAACEVRLLTENMNGESASVSVEYGNGMTGTTVDVPGAFSPRIYLGTEWLLNLPVDLTVTVTDGLLRLTGVSFPFRKD